MNSTNLTLSHIITAIWLQIVTIIPMDGESIRRFVQVFLSSPEYNATSVRIISSNVDAMHPTAMYS